MELFEPQLLEHGTYYLVVSVGRENAYLSRRVFGTAFFLLKFLEKRTWCLLEGLNIAECYILFNVQRNSLLSC